MNELSTVKPLYPGAFPQTDTDESDAPYPKAPLNLTLGFDLETFQIPLEELMPSKKAPDGVMTTRNFKQIVSSIREIGLIEPLSVIKPDPDAAGFLLLDGNLRVLALKELGQDTAPCLIAKDFETYTYNHRINRLSRRCRSITCCAEQSTKASARNGSRGRSTSTSRPSTAG